MTRRVVITGADGFLGWHLRCRLQAISSDEVVGLGRAGLADHQSADAALIGADVVIHAAGVNRGPDDSVVRGNEDAARQLVSACERVGVLPHITYADSIQRDRDTAYGRGKRIADELMQDWAASRGASYSGVRLPNLFGEHGRPHYNSVVATFCHWLAAGVTPEVDVDAEIPLLHVQRAAAALLAASDPAARGIVEPAGRPMLVSDLRDLLSAQATCYSSGEIPDLSDSFATDLFNTYRSYTFPKASPVPIPSHTDDRGSLFECVRSHGGTGQTFLSSSRPGVTRGEHFHLHKVERFIVVAGRGQIRLRRLFTDEVVTFDVDGATPVLVDMPTMWAHSITNTGPDDMVTLFWTDQLFDPACPDTYSEPVVRQRVLSVP